MPALSRALYSLTVTKVAGASVLALEPDLRRMEQAVAEDRVRPAAIALGDEPAWQDVDGHARGGVRGAGGLRQARKCL